MMSNLEWATGPVLDNDFFVGLLQNTAILLSLSLLYEFMWLRQKKEATTIKQLGAGVVIGFIAFVLMKTPWTMAPGIAFDTRSVLLSVAGFYFGALPTIVAMGFAAFARVAAGGDGMWMGITVIFASGIIGLMWRQLPLSTKNAHMPFNFLLLGLSVHAVMLLCTFLLPAPAIMPTMQRLALPLLTVYTPATMLLGMFLMQQKKNHENRKAAEKLSESELTFESLFNNHSAIKLILDPNDGSIINANQAALKFYGYTLVEMKMMNISDINTLPIQQLREKINDVRLNKRNHFEFRHKKQNGEIVDVEAFISTISIGNKEFLHSIVNDVSEKKQLIKDLVIAKEKAEESDRLKSRFLMNMSHDIKTPLNGILGFASILKESPGSSTETKDFADIIYRSGQQLHVLINDIIEISRIEAGSVQLNVEDVDAGLVITEAAQSFQQKAAEKGVQLVINIPDKPNHQISFRVDPFKLHRILMNLIGNAIKFSEKGTIDVGYSISDHSVSYYVKDQGIGIHPEHHAHIFERFYQVDSPLSDTNPGTGLGLAICMGLTKLLNGSLTVESEPGKGSTFTLILPRE